MRDEKVSHFPPKSENQVRCKIRDLRFAHGEHKIKKKNKKNKNQIKKWKKENKGSRTILLAVANAERHSLHLSSPPKHIHI